MPRLNGLTRLRSNLDHRIEIGWLGFDTGSRSNMSRWFWIWRLRSGGVWGGGGLAVVAGWPAEGEAARERRRPGGAGSPVGGAGGGGEKKDGAAAAERRGGVLG